MNININFSYTEILSFFLSRTNRRRRCIRTLNNKKVTIVKSCKKPIGVTNTSNQSTIYRCTIKIKDLQFDCHQNHLYDSLKNRKSITEVFFIPA